MKANFIRKPTIQELIPQDEYKIEKTITLTPARFADFKDDILNDQEFIIENKHAMYTDNDGTVHCILVTADGADHGILVDSEGADYARYAAYLPIQR